jgi:signal peptidase I
MHTKSKDDEFIEAEQEAVEVITKKTKKKDEGFWRFTIIMLLIFLGIRFFVAEPFLVSGASMDPNFATNDYLIIDELTYKLEKPQRGDVVVLRPPVDQSKYFIKRIIGLPGERIVVANKQTHIYNKEHPEGFLLDEPYVKLDSDKSSDTTLGSTEYFVMGDNRGVSYDSRSWGALQGSEITGRAFLRLYPFGEISLFPGGLEEFSKKK